MNFSQGKLFTAVFAVVFLVALVLFSGNIYSTKNIPETTAKLENIEKLNPADFDLPADAQEVVDRRTEKAITFQTALGKFVSISNGVDIFTKDEKGNFVPIKKSGRQEGDYFIFDRLARGVKVYFDLNRPSYTFSQGDYSFTATFNAPAQGFIENDSSIAYYFTDNVFMRWKVEGNRVKEEIWVMNDSPLPDLSFRLTSSKNLSLTRDGNLLNFVNANQEAVFNLSAPHIADGENNRLDVPILVKQLPNNIFFYDYNASDLPYPYVIDPTTESRQKSPGSVVDSLNSGQFIAWTNASNAQTSDDQYATNSYSGSGGTESHNLKATNFGFDLPPDASIDGIIASVEAKCGACNGDHISFAKLLQAGSGVGTGKTSGNFTTSDVIYSLGSATDLWGASWTVSDIEHSNFGIQVEIDRDDGVATVSSVDHIQLTVHYTIPDYLKNAGASLPARQIEQAAFRFFDNDNSVEVGPPLSNINDDYIDIRQGVPFRLRLLLYIEGQELKISDGKRFKLQVAERSGSCSQTSASAYKDVLGSSGPVRFYDNNKVPLDANLKPSRDDPTYLGKKAVTQVYIEVNSFTNSADNIPVSESGMWDFPLVVNNDEKKSYCLRVVNDDATTINNYLRYPEVRVGGAEKFIPQVAINNALAVQPAVQAPVAQSKEISDFKENIEKGKEKLSEQAVSLPNTNLNLGAITTEAASTNIAFAKNLVVEGVAKFGPASVDIATDKIAFSSTTPGIVFGGGNDGVFTFYDATSPLDLVGNNPLVKIIDKGTKGDLEVSGGFTVRGPATVDLATGRLGVGIVAPSEGMHVFGNDGRFQLESNHYAHVIMKSDADNSSGFGPFQWIMAASGADTGEYQFRFKNRLGQDTTHLAISKEGYIGIGFDDDLSTINNWSRLTFFASTTPRGGISFGTDTKLYRSAIGTLKTDSNFLVNGNVDITGQYLVNGIPIAGGGGGGGWSDDGTIVRLTSVADNVGIGTATPSTKLHVVGDTTLVGNLSINGQSYVFPSVAPILGQVLTAGTGGVLSWQTLSGSAPNGWVDDGGVVHLGSDLDNVGIGTTTPGAKLEVAGQVKITGGLPGAGKVLTSDAFGLATWQSLPVSIDSGWTDDGSVIRLTTISDNIGIGTISPDFKLDVAGSLRLEGANALLFGGVGSIDADTNLYRSAANVLKTDDSLVVAGGLAAASLNISGVTAFNGVNYTWPTAAPAGKILTSNAGGVLSWNDPPISGSATKIATFEVSFNVNNDNTEFMDVNLVGAAPVVFGSSSATLSNATSSAPFSAAAPIFVSYGIISSDVRGKFFNVAATPLVATSIPAGGRVKVNLNSSPSIGGIGLFGSPPFGNIKVSVTAIQP